MERRKFIKNTALASSLVFVPSFVKAFDSALASQLGHKKLVIIQLAGGNDGLNTVVPYRNDIYFRSRPSLSLRKNDIIKITDDIGFNPNLMPLRRLYDKGYLSIINNVGYPNPDRSHFRSTDIWQTASDSNQYLKTGWIGRYLDYFGKEAHNAIQVDQNLSLALKGKKLSGLATTDAKRLFNRSQLPFIRKVLKNHQAKHLCEHNLGYLYQTMISAESSAKYIYETSKTVTSKKEYPKNSFSKQLKTIAEFVNSGLSTNVYYASLSGFDTHANQNGTQSRLLKAYAESVEAFVDDLKQNDTFKDTLILTFSEFGRRVEQNAAKGTDHGAANNVFIIGEHLKSQGIYNKLSSLRDLDSNGDIKYEIDFRSVYATILNKWLDVDDTKVLNQNFNRLNFI